VITNNSQLSPELDERYIFIFSDSSDFLAGFHLIL
jgi:hypothetical protein